MFNTYLPNITFYYRSEVKRACYSSQAKQSEHSLSKVCSINPIMFSYTRLWAVVESYLDKLKASNL